MHSPETGLLSQELKMQSVKMDLLETKFLEGCKTGNSEILSTCLAQGVDVNCMNGWGLRRTVCYQHQNAWEVIVQEKLLKVNLRNKFGLSALHTASRFINSLLRNLFKNAKAFQIQHSKCAAMPSTASTNPSQ
jgi:ankyrin repeat protein